jgi:hypothetical protein
MENIEEKWMKERMATLIHANRIHIAHIFFGIQKK